MKEVIRKRLNIKNFEVTWGKYLVIELKPLGITCNLKCTYCYQNPQRDVEGFSKIYNLEKMKKTLDKVSGRFVLFGGEPLLLPLKDLEEIFSWGYQKSGGNQIQSNGTLIESEHILLFKKYNVSVGISMDGPDELNNLRFIGDKETTLRFTKKTEDAINRLCQEGIKVGLIITLHRLNADPKRLPRLTDWIKKIDRLGIKEVRIHLLESESQEIHEKYSLSIEENINALATLMLLESHLKNIRFDIFSEMLKMLLGKDESCSCIWRGCDPYTTKAVRGIDGNGQLTNCDRTNKDGINYQKSDRERYERYISLYNTPYEFGGCKDCRFFLMCKGNCPGTSIDGDWRNRTEHCEIWKSLYAIIENILVKNGIIPISADEDLRGFFENEFLQQWSKGRNTSMESLIRKTLS